MWLLSKIKIQYFSRKSLIIFALFRRDWGYMLGVEGIVTQVSSIRPQGMPKKILLPDVEDEDDDEDGDDDEDEDYIEKFKTEEGLWQKHQDYPEVSLD